MAVFHNPSDEPANPVDAIRHYLSVAISIGAPSYNYGDQRGCYEVYATTARMLLQAIEGAEEQKKLLRQTLQRCATMVDVDQQAWAMRNTFDALLGKEDN
jgi:hypothetical protein